MTKRAGAALSHVLIGAGQSTFFHASGQRIFRLDRIGLALLRKSQAAIRSAAGRMAA